MTAPLDPDTLARLKRIRLLLLDVDGVLTDGRLYYGPDGDTLKAFSARDGLGLRLALESGLQVGIVTGRRGPALAARCRELGITMVFDGVGVRDKAAVLETIAAQTGVALEEMAFVGDDLPDLAPMHAVGLAVAVADADETVRRAAHLVTTAAGGRGAVREVCRHLLAARGQWASILRDFGGKQ
jgi:3-deoxy-D-manno-octulosonate 8-phosphate phosphatase (KDO 8-P phosphatase)